MGREPAPDGEGLSRRPPRSLARGRALSTDVAVDAHHRRSSLPRKADTGGARQEVLRRATVGFRHEPPAPAAVTWGVGRIETTTALGRPARGDARSYMAILCLVPSLSRGYFSP